MGSTTTETQKSEMDPFQKEVLQYGFDYAKKNIVDQPFQAYTGNVVSGLTDVEKGLLDRYMGMDTGQAAYGAARDVAAGIAQETPEQRAARVSQYANQYTQGVVDPTIALMERERAKQRVNEAATRTAAKAFGSRGDVYQGALEGEYQANLSKTIADLMQRGMDYGTARASAETQERLGAAGQLASTAGAGLQAELAGLGAMSGAAALPRQLDQAQLDFALSEFMREQNLPLQKLGAIGAVGGMIPAGLGTVTGTKTDPFGGLSAIGGMMSGAGSLGQGFGAMRSAGFFGGSDVRLKKDIKRVGSKGGINMYTWQWNDEAKKIGVDDHPTFGVMAQELEKTHPEYVVTGDDGYKRVNYGGLYQEMGMA